MSSNKLSTLAAVGVLILAAQTMAEAQAPIGVRAQGLAGAFVGVADDATAVYWNPAGLASGAFVSAVAELGRQSEGERSGILAISAPPVGFAYYRANTFAAGAPKTVVSGVPGREEVRRSVHALSAGTVGVALLHSLTDHLVVGGALKLVRGEAAAAESRSETKGDVDLSAMSSFGPVRLGVVARNLTAPSFALDAAATEAVELQRQVRVGGGWGSGWPGISRVVVAVDADVTRRVSPGGDRRDLAAGAETWWLSQRLGLRGGVRRSTIGASRPVVAGGVSAALRPGMLIEAHVARGQQEEHSWSIGLRFGF